MPRNGLRRARTGPHRPRRTHGILQPLLPIRHRENVREGQGTWCRRIHRRGFAPGGGSHARQELQQVRIVQYSPHRAHDDRSAHRALGGDRLHLHLLRFHHGRDGSTCGSAPGPRRFHREGEETDGPPPSGRVRHLQSPDGPERGQFGRWSRGRKCHSQDRSEGWRLQSRTRRGRQEDRVGAQRGMQAGSGRHEPGHAPWTQTGRRRRGRDRQAQHQGSLR
mmetsp:Transcript_21380/g.38298  ORF Transcript_21380/g.38298 Transcript_21380/m.38298 type:complete len:221 (+) Transcript_21380:460-1122(+)